jgi:hypothetical protein
MGKERFLILIPSLCSNGVKVEDILNCLFKMLNM